MRFVPVSEDQREKMLGVVGVADVRDLFSDIPAAARLDRALDLPEGMSEIDLAGHLGSLAAADFSSSDLVSFAGAGCYDHYIPAVVDHVLRRPEFFTAYTPYQPEISQGTLQAIYEYQTGICELTGMDVSNASMYDGATAFVEAALMAVRLTRRKRILVASTVHPDWLETLNTYALSGLLEVAIVDSHDGIVDADALSSSADASVAAIMVQNPNFFGVLEDLGTAGESAHAHGALFVVASDPILLGVVEPPSSYGADIVVGEGRSLGNPMSFGGPGLGFFACRQQHVRQMPGRLVGRTTDVDGATGFVLTIATREQHIRREKATSNICSNHALNALAAGAYLAAVGPRGLAEMATACVEKAHYLHDGLVATGRFSSPWDHAFGFEFALRYDGDVRAMQEAMLEKGFIAGVAHEGLVLFAVTEKRTCQELDDFIEEVSSL